MALMGGNSGSAPATGQPAGADKDAAFKAKKLEALKRFKERRAERAQQAYDNALKLRDELTKAGLLDKLSAESKAFVLELCKSPAEKRTSVAGNSPVFNTLFGSSPKVGDKITLEQAFNKTYKGKSTLDVWVKRWAEKGIIVECVIDPKVMLNTTYTIKALP